jgi:hypothetical protein
MRDRGHHAKTLSRKAASTLAESGTTACILESFHATQDPTDCLLHKQTLFYALPGAFSCRPHSLRAPVVF